MGLILSRVRGAIFRFRMIKVIKRPSAQIRLFFLPLFKPFRPLALALTLAMALALALTMALALTLALILALALALIIIKLISLIIYY